MDDAEDVFSFKLFGPECALQGKIAYHDDRNEEEEHSNNNMSSLPFVLSIRLCSCWHPVPNAEELHTDTLFLIEYSGPVCSDDDHDRCEGRRCRRQSFSCW